MGRTEANFVHVDERLGAGNFVSTGRGEDGAGEGFAEPGNPCLFAKLADRFAAHRPGTAWRGSCVRRVPRRCFSARRCEEYESARGQFCAWKIELRSPAPLPVLIYRCFLVSRLEQELQESP